MTVYRYRLTPLSAFVTPPRSDTWYGHLLWAAAEMNGKEKVVELIGDFCHAKPPFLLSTAFPAGMLPLPVLPPIPRQVLREKFAGSHNTSSLYDTLSHYKRFRKQKYIREEAWQRLSGTMSQTVLFTEFLHSPHLFSREKTERHSEPHNSIDRHTDTVLPEGGLHFPSAYFYGPGTQLDLYVASDEPEYFEQLLEHISQSGFGADRSTGKGHFSWQRDTSFSPESFQIAGSHQMTLSVLSCEDMRSIRGHYDVFMKHGRAWNGYGENNPFKKPFLAINEGAVFSQLPDSGFVLRNIHSNPEIVQVLWPLTIPLNLEEEA